MNIKVAVKKLLMIAVAGALQSSFSLSAVSQSLQELEVSVEMKPDTIRFGETPKARVTIKNIGGRSRCPALRDSNFIPHVMMGGKEIEPSERLRHMRGDYRSGDGPELADGPVVCTPIAPGASSHSLINLSDYYRFVAAGGYSFYIEVFDVLDIPIRSNTSSFTMLDKSER